MSRRIILIINILFWFLLFSGSAQIDTPQFDLANLRLNHPEFTRAYDRIKIQPAWEFLNSKNFPLTDVIIGIIDTAIQKNHSEFTGVDLGRTPLKLFNDPEGHGTSVSGIIGANNLSFTQTLPENSPQMNGIVSGVKGLNYVMGLRGIKSKPKDVGNDLNDLIITGGAQIINLSLHGVATSSLLDFQRLSGPALGAMRDIAFQALSEFYQNYITEQSSTLFVIISGNHNLKSSSSTPGNVIAPNAIIVGATDARDPDITKEKRAIFATTTVGIFPPEEVTTSASNFGEGVNISAPGVGIYAPTNRAIGNFPTSSLEQFLYRTDLQGTSFAAPLVTGVAAILKSIKPEFTPAEIKDILIRTADPIQTGEPDKRLGAGCYTNPNDPVNTGCRLNALKAVQELLIPPPPPPTATIWPQFQHA